MSCAWACILGVATVACILAIKFDKKLIRRIKENGSKNNETGRT